MDEEERNLKLELIGADSGKSAKTDHTGKRLIVSNLAFMPPAVYPGLETFLQIPLKSR